MKDGAIEKSFCTTSEAAELLGVSVGTVQLWVESGLLQAWKTAGGHRRVVRNSVLMLLHKRPAPEAAVAEAFTQPGELGPRPMRVLVVDDDAALLRLYQVKLSQWPMRAQVQVLDNAVAGLLQIGRSSPDLLVVDLNMPGMDGFNMLRVLRKTPEVDRTHIVVVSGLDATDIAHRGGIPPDIAVLPKPVPFDRLLTIAQGVAQQLATLHPEL